MTPILVKGDDVRSETEVNTYQGQLWSVQELNGFNIGQTKYK